MIIDWLLLTSHAVTHLFQSLAYLSSLFFFFATVCSLSSRFALFPINIKMSCVLCGSSAAESRGGEVSFSEDAGGLPGRAGDGDRRKYRAHRSPGCQNAAK